METFSALLAIWAGNSPVNGEIPAQRPVTRSFDVFFDLRLNKRLSNQSWGWWFETLSHPLWRRCNDRHGDDQSPGIHSRTWTFHEGQWSIHLKLTAKSHEVSKPRDSSLDFSSRSDIWRAPRQQRCWDACQISERCDHYNIQSGDFESSRNFRIRRLTA